MFVSCGGMQLGVNTNSSSVRRSQLRLKLTDVLDCSSRDEVYGQACRQRSVCAKTGNPHASPRLRFARLRFGYVYLFGSGFLEGRRTREEQKGSPA